MPGSRPRRADYENGPNAAARFESTLERLLRVSKEELAKREAEYQKAASIKPVRRGRRARD
jgi:hypothetical protein